MRQDAPIQADFSLRFQIKYILILMAGSVLTTLLYALYLDISVGESYRQSLMTIRDIGELLPLSLTLTFLVHALLIVVVSAAIYLFVSHKIAGPIYRFEHFLNKVMEGDLRTDVRIRDDDQLQTMVGCMNDMVRSMRTVHVRLNGLCDEIDHTVDALRLGDSVNWDLLRRHIEAVREAMGEFEEENDTTASGGGRS